MAALVFQASRTYATGTHPSAVIPVPPGVDGVEATLVSEPLPRTTQVVRVAVMVSPTGLDGWVERSHCGGSGGSGLSHTGQVTVGRVDCLMRVSGLAGQFVQVITVVEDGPITLSVTGSTT